MIRLIFPTIFASIFLIFSIFTAYTIGYYQRPEVQGVKTGPTDTPMPTLTSTPTPTEAIVVQTKVITPTVMPTNQPTNTPIPEPTQNPNKDSICKNKAELERMKLEESLSRIAASKLPPEVLTRDYDMIMQGIKNEAQKAYLQIYNICLTQ